MNMRLKNLHRVPVEHVKCPPVDTFDSTCYQSWYCCSLSPQNLWTEEPRIYLSESEHRRTAAVVYDCITEADRKFTITPLTLFYPTNGQCAITSPISCRAMHNSRPSLWNARPLAQIATETMRQLGHGRYRTTSVHVRRRLSLPQLSDGTKRAQI